MPLQSSPLVRPVRSGRLMPSSLQAFKTSSFASSRGRASSQGQRQQSSKGQQSTDQEATVGQLAAVAEALRLDMACLATFVAATVATKEEVAALKDEMAASRVAIKDDISKLAKEMVAVKDNISKLANEMVAVKDDISELAKEMAASRVAVKDDISKLAKEMAASQAATMTVLWFIFAAAMTATIAFGGLFAAVFVLVKP